MSRGRIEKYLLAYSLFKAAWCKMAAAAMNGTGEANRLLREYREISSLCGKYRCGIQLRR